MLELQSTRQLQNLAKLLIIGIRMVTVVSYMWCLLYTLRHYLRLFLEKLKKIMKSIFEDNNKASICWIWSKKCLIHNTSYFDQTILFGNWFWSTISEKRCSGSLVCTMYNRIRLTFEMHPCWGPVWIPHQLHCNSNPVHSWAECLQHSVQNLQRTRDYFLTCCPLFSYIKLSQFLGIITVVPHKLIKK